jgi:hypothetical protein
MIQAKTVLNNNLLTMSVQTTNYINREKAELKALEKMKYSLLPSICSMNDEELEDYIEEEFDNYRVVTDDFTLI